MECTGRHRDASTQTYIHMETYTDTDIHTHKDTYTDRYIRHKETQTCRETHMHTHHLQTHTDGHTHAHFQADTQAGTHRPGGRLHVCPRDEGNADMSALLGWVSSCVHSSKMALLSAACEPCPLLAAQAQPLSSRLSPWSRVSAASGADCVLNRLARQPGPALLASSGLALQHRSGRTV